MFLIVLTTPLFLQIGILISISFAVPTNSHTEENIKTLLSINSPVNEPFPKTENGSISIFDASTSNYYYVKDKKTDKLTEKSLEYHSITYKAKMFNSKTGKEVALKRLKSDTCTNFEYSVSTEVKSLKAMKLLEGDLVSISKGPTKGECYIPIKMLYGMTLENLILQDVNFVVGMYEKGKLSQPGSLIRVMQDTLTQMNLLHSKKILHGNLERKNVMVDRKRGYAVTVIDFGLAIIREAKLGSFEKNLDNDKLCYSILNMFGTMRKSISEETNLVRYPENVLKRYTDQGVLDQVNAFCKDLSV